MSRGLIEESTSSLGTPLGFPSGIKGLVSFHKVPDRGLGACLRSDSRYVNMVECLRSVAWCQPFLTKGKRMAYEVLNRVEAVMSLGQ